jgi:hypothetical protein
VRGSRWGSHSLGVTIYSLAASACLVVATFATILDSSSVDRSAAVFVDILAVFLLAPLLLSVWSVIQANYGSAVAWSYVALPIVVFSTLLSLHFIRPSRLLGLVSCDAMANDCGGAPLTRWVPVILLASCNVLLALSIQASKAQATASTVVDLLNENPRLMHEAQTTP